MPLSLEHHMMAGTFYAYGQMDAGITAPGADATEFGRLYAEMRTDSKRTFACAVQDAWKNYLLTKQEMAADPSLIGVGLVVTPDHLVRL